MGKYNTKKVDDFITDLIIFCEYKKYSEISFSHKCEFAALLIEAIPNAEAECLTESNDLDEIIGTLRNALTGTKEADENFLFTIKKNVIRYFDNTMEMLFTDAIDKFHYERNQWSDSITYDDDDEETINVDTQS